MFARTHMRMLYAYSKCIRSCMFYVHTLMHVPYAYVNPYCMFNVGVCVCACTHTCACVWAKYSAARNLNYSYDARRRNCKTRRRKWCVSRP